MRMSNYGAMAALGITRVGDAQSGIVRQISMAGFGVIGAGNDPRVGYHESNQTAGTQCPKDDSGPAPYSRYCGCMYGEKDRVSSDKKNADDFAWGSPRWACQSAAQTVGKPWNCGGVIVTWLLSGGQADPLRHLATGPKLEEYKRCAQQEWERIKGIVEPVLPGAKAALQAAGFLPPDDSTAPISAQPAPTQTTPGIVGGTRPLRPQFFMPMPAFPGATPKPESKSAIPTGLLVGGGLAVVAALFLLKK